MPTETLTIRSSIKTELFKKILLRGSFFSALGFIPLLYGSLWMNASTLSTWGIPLFFLGIGFITLGMLPYKRLTTLQQHPNCIHLIDEKTLIYEHLGKQTLSIPLQTIESASYQEDPSNYGICIFLESRPEEKIIVQDPRFAYERYQNESRKRYGCDLFFPYFSKRGFDKLIGSIPDKEERDSKV
jgi:hypothetical protein